MLPDHASSPKNFLAPHERISEILFGLIMVLTFTGSLSVAEAGREDVRSMLVGALGCNLAWGIIDAVLYVMGSLAEKGRMLMLLHAMRAESNPEKGRKLVASAIPPVVASILRPEELDSIQLRLKQQPEPPRRARMDLADLAGASGVFLLVFLSTFPVALPFIFMHNSLFALRVSNAIAVALLFFVGVGYGRCVGRSPWGIGVSMVVVGVSLVALTMALGG